MSLKRYPARNRAKSPLLLDISTIFTPLCNPPIKFICNPSTRMHRTCKLLHIVPLHFRLHFNDTARLVNAAIVQIARNGIQQSMLPIRCDSFEMGLRPPILYTPIYTLSQCRAAHLTRFSQERRKQQKKSLSVAKNFFPFSAFFPFFHNQKNWKSRKFRVQKQNKFSAEVQFELVFRQ